MSKNLWLSLSLFIFCKNRFSKNLVFLTDIVADMAMCYTLCHGILCVPTVYLLKNYSLPSEIQCGYLYINFFTECHHISKEKFYSDLFKVVFVILFEKSKENQIRFPTSLLKKIVLVPLFRHSRATMDRKPEF